MKYKKTPFTVNQHIELLKQRGLIIEDENRARKYLKNVGYFRLSGYMYHLQLANSEHTFKNNIKFADVISHYQFDKKLKAIMLEYLERIEIALRARLTDKYSNSFGFYWYTDKFLFEDIGNYNSINNDILAHFANPQERFLRAFKNKIYRRIITPFQYGS